MIEIGGREHSAHPQDPVQHVTGRQEFEVSQEGLEEELSFHRWPDALIDRLGYDAESDYVEYFWLPILGPSSIWLFRRVSQMLKAAPSGVQVKTLPFGRSLGLGGNSGGRSLIAKTLSRCVYFELARPTGPNSFSFKEKLAPLSARQLERLPADLKELHRQGASLFFGQREGEMLQARRMALSLAYLGEDHEFIRGQLIDWRFSESAIEEATAWLCRQVAYPMPEGPGYATNATS